MSEAATAVVEEAVPASGAAGADSAAGASPKVTDPVEAARILKRFIRCRPGRSANYCNGRGVISAVVGGQRAWRLCACIENAVRESKQREENANGFRASLSALGAVAAELPAPAVEGRHVLPGARDKADRLRRELAKETGRLTAAREKAGAAIAGMVDELTALAAEEAFNKREAAAAEGTRKVAGFQLEEARARLAALKGQVEEATAALERLANAAGTFGARRMELEARVVETRKRLVPNEKESVDRIESLGYRLEQHLARWPELGEDRVA